MALSQSRACSTGSTTSRIAITCASTCLLFVHHNRKASGENDEEILGSTAMTGSFDTILSMRSRAQQRSVYGFGRDDVQLEDTLLVYDDDTGMVRAAATVEGAARRKVEDRVMEFLRSEDEWTDNSRIKSEVTGRATEIIRALRRLADDGVIESHRGASRGGGLQYRFSEPVPIPITPEQGTGTEVAA